MERGFWRLFTTVLSVHDARTQLANKVRLEDGNFVWFPEIWTRKYTVITEPVISVDEKFARAFQRESYSILEHAFISSLLQSLFFNLSKETASVLNHKTRSWDCKGSAEGFKCYNSVPGTESISGFGCGFGDQTPRSCTWQSTSSLSATK